jgi:hypothetical protein
MEAESTRIFGGQKVLLQETDRALTPFGGMVVFLEFLNSPTRPPVGPASQAHHV